MIYRVGSIWTEGIGLLVQMKPTAFGALSVSTHSWALIGVANVIANHSVHLYCKCYRIMFCLYMAYNGKFIPIAFTHKKRQILLVISLRYTDKVDIRHCMPSTVWRGRQTHDTSSCDGTPNRMARAVGEKNRVYVNEVGTRAGLKRLAGAGTRRFEKTNMPDGI